MPQQGRESDEMNIVDLSPAEGNLQDFVATMILDDVARGTEVVSIRRASPTLDVTEAGEREWESIINSNHMECSLHFSEALTKLLR